MAQQAQRPTTCHQQFLLDPALGAEGCKRLPRHGGEHRGHLTRRAEAKALAAKAAKAAAPKAAKAAAPKVAPKGRAATKAEVAKAVREARAAVGQPRGRMNAAKRREAIAAVMAAQAEGRITISIALGAVVALG